MQNLALGVVVVGAAVDLVGAVGLLGDNEASDEVRENEVAETPEKIGAVADGLAETVGATDEDDHFPTLF